MCEQPLEVEQIVRYGLCDIVWSTSVCVPLELWGGVVGCCCGLLLWGAVVGCCCGVLLWGAVVGCCCGVLLWGAVVGWLW
jgi:hypothetical protein